MRIACLADHPRHAETLAAWHHAQWSHLFADWTLDAALAELRDHATRRHCPTTLVALADDGALLGSASLIDKDAEELDDRGSPWLASVYVRPDARGAGVGGALVREIVRLAAGDGTPWLHLFTSGQRDWYARQGWRDFGTATLNGVPVRLMRIAPARAGRAA